MGEQGNIVITLTAMTNSILNSVNYNVKPVKTVILLIITVILMINNNYRCEN